MISIFLFTLISLYVVVAEEIIEEQKCPPDIKLLKNYSRNAFFNDLKQHFVSSTNYLELGPFVIPLLRGDDVKYFDVSDRAGIMQRANNIPVYALYNPLYVPHIHYISPTGNLNVIQNDTFAGIFSSHCIEHQVDLVDHLQQISRLLQEDAHFVLIVPDARYGADQARPLTVLRDVLAAHWARNADGTHPLTAWLENQCEVSNDDAKAHWRGEHGKRRIDNDPDCYVKAKKSYDDAEGKYLDLHRWKLTPCVFASIVTRLREIGLIDLHITYVSDTVVGGGEFYSILSKVPLIIYGRD
jgi:SAM-dependent methyltransferase